MQIKSRIVLSAILFISTYAAIAQNDTAPFRKTRIGLKFSPNFNWTKVTDGKFSSNGAGLGYSYGIMADLNIANDPNYWFNVEFLVSSMKTRIKSNDTLYITNQGVPQHYSNAEFDYRLQYLQVPISLKLKTTEIGNFVYYGQFGLGTSFLINSKLVTTTKENYYTSGTSSHSPNANENDDIDFNGDGNGRGSFKDNVIPIRMSMILGAGVEYKISGKTILNLGLRFDNNFTDLFWDSNVKGINNYLGLQIGVFF